MGSGVTQIQGNIAFCISIYDLMLCT